MFLAFYCFIYLFIITDNTCKIYWYDCFCFFCYQISQFLIIHLKAILSTIYHNWCCTYMTNDTAACCICISWNNNFITFSYSKNMKCQLHSCCCTIQTNCFVCPYIFRDSFSNSFVRGPVVIHPDMIAFFTSSTSNKLISGGENGIFFS